MDNSLTQRDVAPARGFPDDFVDAPTELLVRWDAHHPDGAVTSELYTVSSQTIRRLANQRDRARSDLDYCQVLAQARIHRLEQELEVATQRAVELEKRFVRLLLKTRMPPLQVK
ncbi:MAG: hypothetical protein H6718_36170 [Polyangiaceae bacterium]|nr:hypothetical protein [Polyangiaceae bacterium]